MTIESRFDIPFIANLALREKQIQQNYRPVIAVHKWFARRPGSLFRGLLLSEFVDQPLEESYYKPQRLDGIKIADPFMGGGTPVLEANRAGCDVVGIDVNPMAHWIVTEEITDIDLIEYDKASQKLASWLKAKVGQLYTTRCTYCDASTAHVKYFLWVKQLRCNSCSREFDLFPGYQLAQDRRHTRNVLICHTCGQLNEIIDITQPGNCKECDNHLLVSGPAKKNHCPCPYCGTVNKYPSAKDGPPRHRMFAIEYLCSDCRGEHTGRFFKRPDALDISRFESAMIAWRDSPREFVPSDRIPEGDETNRLHRWGYTQYAELFNDRQLLGLDILCSGITKHPNERIRHALSTNLSDLLRYQNMLCRYDVMALKSLDIFSVHGFPVGLIQCESNIIGVQSESRSVIGSGGWINITEKYRKAKRYCQNPFEILHKGSRKVVIPMVGEWIGGKRETDSSESRVVTLQCSSSTDVELPRASIDAIFTDPPYFGNVQYAELMDFCYVWLRRLVGKNQAEFTQHSTRRKDELTGNITMDRDLAHFAGGLSEVFTRMAQALKPGHPFAFTYHHNRIEAYLPVAVAILDANLICTKAIPCPAEMGGSIHISGSGSSILDTVFVCRCIETNSNNLSGSPTDEVIKAVSTDVAQLREANIRVSKGDVRCLTFGHVTRMTVSWLRDSWNRGLNIEVKLNILTTVMLRFGCIDTVVDHVLAVVMQSE